MHDHVMPGTTIADFFVSGAVLAVFDSVVWMTHYRVAMSPRELG